MTTIHLHSNKTYEPEVNGNARAVYFLLVIAIFIIVIAWVNYVNLSTARAVERAREVGIRKVMGSLKMQLILAIPCRVCIGEYTGWDTCLCILSDRHAVVPCAFGATGDAWSIDRTVHSGCC